MNQIMKFLLILAVSMAVSWGTPDLDFEEDIDQVSPEAFDTPEELGAEGSQSESSSLEVLPDLVETVSKIHGIPAKASFAALRGDRHWNPAKPLDLKQVSKAYNLYKKAAQKIATLTHKLDQKGHEGSEFLQTKVRMDMDLHVSDSQLSSQKWGKAKKKAKEAGNKAKEKAKEVGKKAKKKAKKVAEKAGKAAEKAKEIARKAADKLKALLDLTHKLVTILTSAAKTTKCVLQHSSTFNLKNVLTSPRNAAQNVFDKVQNLVKNLLNKEDETTDVGKDMKEEQDSESDIKKMVDDLLGDVQDVAKRAPVVGCFIPLIENTMHVVKKTSDGMKKIAQVHKKCCVGQ